MQNVRIFILALDSLNEVDLNHHENESTSGSLVMKTFKNAIKTLIEESQNSVRDLELMDKMDKIDKIEPIHEMEKIEPIHEDDFSHIIIHETDKTKPIHDVGNMPLVHWNFTMGSWNHTSNWNYTGPWNSTIANNTLNRIMEAVFDDTDFDMNEVIPKIDELIIGPMIPLFAMVITMVMVMAAIPFLISSMIMLPLLFSFAIPFLTIGSIFFGPMMLFLEDV